MLACTWAGRGLAPLACYCMISHGTHHEKHSGVFPGRRLPCITRIHPVCSSCFGVPA